MTRPDDTRDRGFGEKGPNEIEAEIEHTRSKISERLNAISEKLSPEQIKEEAKQALGDAKKAVVGKLRDAKDSALQSVNETMHDVGEHARRAGEVSYGYARENAVPLGLIGLGIGWLVMSGRRRQSADRYRSLGEQRAPYGSYGIESAPDFSESDWSERTGSFERERDRGTVRRTVDETRERAEELSGQATRHMEKGVERARGRTRELGQRASELGQRARNQAIRAEHEALDFARENPLAVGAAALAVGVGIGFLLPPTRREDELLGEQRDRLVDDIRGSVEGVGRAAKDTAREVQGALREVP